MDETTVKKKSKISEFFKDKTNWILIGIIAFALIIRLYYFVLTKGQALWWDESEYLAMAKSWIHQIPALNENLNPQRTILFPGLIALFYLIGFSDIMVKFLVVLIPSVLVVYIMYLIGKEMYNKKIGLISAFLMSIFWLLIFNTNRFHTDALGMLFSFLAILFFWKRYVTDKKRKYMLWVALFLALGILIRPLVGINVFILGVFLILMRRTRIIKDKYLWVSTILGFIVLIPLLIYNYSKFNLIFAFISSYSTGLDPSGAWKIFTFFQWFSEWIFFIIFIIGIIYILFNLIVGYDYIFKKKNLTADFFNVWLILAYLSYFLFILRAYPEDRWLMPMTMAIFIITAKGTLFIYDFLKKYHKAIAIIVLGLIFIYGGYSQIAHADSITRAKIDTYKQEPIAGEWIKENTVAEDILISNNEHMPFRVYTERTVYTMGGINNTIKTIIENKPKYLILTAYYPSDEWSYNFPEDHQDSLEPVKVFYEGEQPVIVIYGFKNYNF